MPTFLVQHLTTYRYRNPVALGEHRLSLRPREGLDQRLLGFRLEVDPEPASLRWFEDALGNVVATLRFSRRCHELRVAATMRVEQPEPGPVSTPTGFGSTVPFSYSTLR